MVNPASLLTLVNLCADSVVSGIVQSRDRSFECFMLDQNEICIEGRNRENRNLGYRERLEERNQDTGHRKGKWTFKLERRPSTFDFDIGERLI
jgi:hypothetical protein